MRGAALALGAALAGCEVICPPPGVNVPVTNPDMARRGNLALLPAPGAAVPSNTAPLIMSDTPGALALRREDTGAEVAVERRVGRSANESFFPQAGGFVRLVPALLLPDGAYRVEAAGLTFDGTTDVLVRFTVGLPPDTAPPEAPAITSARYSVDSQCDSGVHSVTARAAVDVGSPPEGLVHEIFLSGSSDSFPADPLAVHGPLTGGQLGWTLTTGPRGQEIRPGDKLYARVRARDLADNAGAWSETWRLVAR